MFGAQDYQAEMEAFQRKTEQEHIIDWVEQEVVKSITPQLVCLNVIILLLDALYMLVSVLSFVCCLPNNPKFVSPMLYPSFNHL